MLFMTSAALGAAQVAVIDFQKVIKESVAAKSIEKQLQNLVQAYQVEIEGFETQLRQGREKLLKQQQDIEVAGVSQAQKEKMVADLRLSQKQFEDEVERLQKKAHERKQALDLAFSVAKSQLQTKTQQIVQDISKVRHVNLVLQQDQVVYRDETLDLTEEVLTILNRQLPDLKIVVPKG